MNAIYYFNSRYATSGTTYEGTGYQVDLGMKIDLSKIYLIAGLSYETFAYTKTNTGTLSPSVTYSHIDPRIGLQFEF